MALKEQRALCERDENERERRRLDDDKRLFVGRFVFMLCVF